jgi:hypothetical protein
VPYELIRRTGERAVADGKATLASIKIATDSQSYFPQSLFIHCPRAEIVKPQRQKPCETQRAPVASAGSSGAGSGAQTCDAFGGSKIYTPLRLLAAILNFLAVAPAQRHRRLGQFACAGSYAEVVTPGVVYRANEVRIEPVQLRQRIRAATIDTMAAALAAGQ